MNCIVQTSEAWATPDVVEFAHRMCAGPTGTIEPRRSFQLAQLCRIWRRSTSKWGYLDTLEVLGVLFAWSWRMSSGADKNCSHLFKWRGCGRYSWHPVACWMREAGIPRHSWTHHQIRRCAKIWEWGMCICWGFLLSKIWNTIVFLFKLLTSSFFPKFGHQVKDSKPWSRSCFRFGDMFFLKFQWKPKIQIQRCWNFYRAWVWVVGMFGTGLISHLFQDLRCDAGHVAHPRNGTACGGRWRLHLQHLAGAKKNPSGCTWKSLKKDHNMLPLCDAAKASDWCSKLLGLCCLKDSIVMWSVKAWETEN